MPSRQPIDSVKKNIKSNATQLDIKEKDEI